jgi:hypothetical protein
MTNRLYVPRAERKEREGQAVVELSPLRRHRLVMETSLARPQYPHVMIYEVVEGARIQGRSTPGATVHLRLRVGSTQRNAAFRYRAEAVVRPDGDYEFVVPYATGASANVRTGERYLLSCGDQSAKVVVPESAVIDGTTVDGPRFQCAASQGIARELRSPHRGAESCESSLRPIGPQ